jgi:GNAT superfamily N-acetyltransferase
VIAAAEIDAARPGDAEALGRMLSGWIDETPWMPRLHTQDDDRAHVADLIGTGNVLVLRAGATVLGFLFETGGHIGALYVDRDARGTGAGLRLLDAAKGASVRLDLWTFAANTGARRFYEREGFREVERTGGDNAEGLADIRMTWSRETHDG